MRHQHRDRTPVSPAHSHALGWEGSDRQFFHVTEKHRSLALAVLIGLPPLPGGSENSTATPQSGRATADFLVVMIHRSWH
jgi:hypothetical protein